MASAIPPGESLIEYPSDFPIKVMGPTHIDFAPTILELVLKHDPTFHKGKMEERPSAKGNYTCLLYTSPSPRDQRGSRMPSSA